MASDRLDLSLSLRSSYVPETITNIFFDLANIDDASQKITILNVYLEKYIEELSRVERFKSELPQCMILLTDAIKVIKKEIKNIEMSLSEFRTQQRTCEQEQSKKFYKNYITQGKDLAESSSIPSRNHPLDYTTQSYKYNEHRKGKEINQGSILSLETHKANIPRIKTEDCSSINTDSDSTTWNNRRHWTPELHAKFEMALHMLGGPQVATPKQIRKIMNIEDLTNDQVKSHLQKYRLYSRRIVQGDANSAGHLTGFQYHWAPDIYYRGL